MSCGPYFFLKVAPDLQLLRALSQDVPTLKGEAREEASPGPSCEGSEQLTVKEGAAKPMLSAATAPDIISLEEGEAAAPRELSRSKSVPGSPSPHSTGGAEKGAGALPDEIPLSEKRLGRKRRHKQKAAEEAASGPRWLPGWTGDTPVLRAPRRCLITSSLVGSLQSFPARPTGGEEGVFWWYNHRAILAFAPGPWKCAKIVDLSGNVGFER